MKITICNSIYFYEQAKEAKSELEKLGHEALTHPMSIHFRGKEVSVIEYYNARKSEWDKEIEDRKEWAIRAHFDKIKSSEAILVLNLDKGGKRNYIGGNTFLEMGVAFALSKKIFLLNPISEELPYAEEIKGMKPTIINNDFSKVK